jgi:AcrR family transcriptional regulator
MSLREKQANARRERILAAAERMIRQTGGTDFSMRSLASAAEVSPATPYNIFRSKEGLLFELLTRNLDLIIQRAPDYQSKDPIGHVLAVGDHVVSTLSADPEYLRPLYQVVLGLAEPIHYPKFLKTAFGYYRDNLRPMVENGMLVDEYECTSLAFSLMAHVIGVLSLWVHQDIDDEWFRAQINYGFIHALWPFASGESLDLLQEESARVRKLLSNQRLLPKLVM